MGVPLRSMAPSAMIMMFRRDPRLRVYVRRLGSGASLQTPALDTAATHEPPRGPGEGSTVHMRSRVGGLWRPTGTLLPLLGWESGLVGGYQPHARQREAEALRAMVQAGGTWVTRMRCPWGTQSRLKAFWGPGSDGGAEGPPQQQPAASEQVLPGAHSDTGVASEPPFSHPYNGMASHAGHQPGLPPPASWSRRASASPLWEGPTAPRTCP